MPVDCAFGPWSIGSCSATCGSSVFKIKRREIAVQAAIGGKDCSGDLEVMENCNLESCPGMDHDIYV